MKNTERRPGSPLQHFIAGWIGASVACVLLSPLEVVKTRLQSAKAATENRMTPTRLAVHIVRTEGIVGLYRGLLPHLLGVGPSRALYFGAYNGLKTRLGKGDSHAGTAGLGMSGTSLHLTAATVSSIFSATIMSPVWVVKTRLQLQDNPAESWTARVQRWKAGLQQHQRPVHAAVTAAAGHASAMGVGASAAAASTTAAMAGALPLAAKSLSSAAAIVAAGPGRLPVPAGAHEPYRGIVDAFVRVWREEGWRGYYRGLGASYLGTVETALQFALYGSLKDHVLASREVALRQAIARGERPQGLTSSSTAAEIRRAGYTDSVAFGTSAAAKLLAAVATYPHEVIRTRLREQRGTGGAAERYTGILQTMRAVHAEEGLRGLYGGMSVHVLRTVPNAAILLMVVERFVGGEV